MKNQTVNPAHINQHILELGTVEKDLNYTLHNQ